MPSIPKDDFYRQFFAITSSRSWEHPERKKRKEQELFDLFKKTLGRDLTRDEFQIIQSDLIHKVLPHPENKTLPPGILSVITQKDLSPTDLEKEIFDASPEDLRLLEEKIAKLCQVLKATHDDDLTAIFKVVIPLFNRCSEEKKNILCEIIGHYLSDIIPLCTRFSKDIEKRLATSMAKSLAAREGRTVSEHINAYQIEDEKTRAEIAKIAIGSDCEASGYIKNYCISSEKERIAIAKIAINLDDKATADALFYYDIQDVSGRLDIFLTGLGLYQDYEVFETFHQYRLPSDHPIVKILQENALLERLLKQKEDPSLLTLVPRAFLSLFPGINVQEIEKFLEAIALEKGRDIQIVLSTWVTYFLCRSFQQGLSSQQVNLLFKREFPQHVFAYRDPIKRFELVEEMIHFAQNEKAQNFEIPSKVKAQMILPSLFISLLSAEGMSKETCSQLLKVADNRLFKDSKNLKVFVSALMLILKEQSLDAKDKEYLVHFLFQKNKEDLLDLLYMICAIFDMQGAHLLTKAILQENSLQELLKSCFQQELPLTFGPNFDARYQKHFEQARIPQYICTYIGKVRTLPNSEKGPVLKALTQCVEGILEENLQQTRYNCDSSPHLAQVFETRPSLLEKWKEGKTVPLKSDPQLSVTDTDDPQDLFLCGTEVEGSCLKITGEPGNNKCLLACVMDGKNRLLAIKDAKGRILARSLLRILWDGEKPVLFLERFYPAVMPPEWRQELSQCAVDRAKELHLPLLGTEYRDTVPFYGRPIYSLGSSAPFEYVDAGEGVTEGTFTIDNAQQLIPNVI